MRQVAENIEPLLGGVERSVGSGRVASSLLHAAWSSFSTFNTSHHLLQTRLEHSLLREIGRGILR